MSKVKRLLYTGMLLTVFLIPTWIIALFVSVQTSGFDVILTGLVVYKLVPALLKKSVGAIFIALLLCCNVTWQNITICPSTYESGEQIFQSLAIDMVPVAGDFKALNELGSGCDSVSNAKIGTFRLIGLISIISPFEGVEDILINGAEHGLKAVDNLAHAGGRLISNGAESLVGSTDNVARTVAKGVDVPNVGKAADSVGSLSKHAGCSFSPDVRVWTGLSPGSVDVNIGRLITGDTVFSFHEPTQEQGIYEILQVHRHLDDNLLAIRLDSSEVITTTTDHPFYTSKGWMVASDLTASTQVKTVHGWIGVQDVSLLPGEMVMYNLSVETAETYYVGEAGVLVHNDCPFFRTRSGENVQVKIDNGGLHEKRIGAIEYTNGFPNFDRFSAVNLQFRHGRLSGNNSAADFKLAFETLSHSDQAKIALKARNPRLYEYLESVNFKPSGWKLRTQDYPAEFSDLPGYTWHHHQDGRTMQLVREDVHESARHTGGSAFIAKDIDPQENGIPLWINEHPGRMLDYTE